ncbi:helix-turn-helix domain-containing protein [bacterium]|nr:helix-turn-helix domain-containing protein [bacterium]MBU1873468.1 helix-turn-helix domain-containing protein [bacterium]
MLFADRIKQLREQRQMPQRQLAAALEIDTATYCKIERGERRAKREQVTILADLFETDKDLLLNLWLAEQIYSVVKDEENAEKVLDIVHESVIEYKSGLKKEKYETTDKI